MTQAGGRQAAGRGSAREDGVPKEKQKRKQRCARGVKRDAAAAAAAHRIGQTRRHVRRGRHAKRWRRGDRGSGRRGNRRWRHSPGRRWRRSPGRRCRGGRGCRLGDLHTQLLTSDHARWHGDAQRAAARRGDEELLPSDHALGNGHEQILSCGGGGGGGRRKRRRRWRR